MADPLPKMVTTGYSQDREFEADLHLLKVFGKTGHDPAKAPIFFRLLLRIMPPQSEQTTSLFSTHPGTVERTERIEAAASGLEAGSHRPKSGDFARLKRTFSTRKNFRLRG